MCLEQPRTLGRVDVLQRRQDAGSFRPNEGQKMLLHIGAPTTHCSEVSYVINRLPGGSDPIAILERMKPGEDKIVELGDGWAETGTYISISAIGHTGGCNEGVLSSWGALTEIYPLP
jgi:hypothetical protein